MKPPPDPRVARRTSRTKNSPDDQAANIRSAIAATPPERAEVLLELRERGVPLTADELCNALEVKPHSLLAFHNRLLAMERDGQLLRNRKGELCIVDKLDLVVGRVEGHPDGHGFLIRDPKDNEERSPDIYLSANEMRKVLNRDRVSARITGTDKRGRPEGGIVEVLERANTRVVGRLFEDRGVWFLVAENKRINQDLIIAPDGRKVGRTAAQPGQVVVAELVAQPTKHSQPVARIVEILGNHTDPGMEIEIALRKHDLPYEFSAAAERQAARLPAEVRAADIKGREDIRDLPLVTIDGETAKDFDDAVYCAPLTDRNARGSYRLVVAIADVSHYVRDGDGIDNDARDRGTSVYFPRRVIPMLPEALSNNLCSLLPEVDRLCMVADMRISSA
ncbi:MAG: RNB domain-containing ribonuclease, partial [Casimicrobiaceae bacterium]